jgi:hypothetical protein
METDPRKMPFGGWFGTLGVCIGCYWGWVFGQWIGVAVGFLIGAISGIIFENLLARVIVIALAILAILIRHEIMKALLGH